MDTSVLKLNDFESFENFLFTEEERKLPEDEKWKKYIVNSEVSDPIFIAPIINPETIEEFQLCHYAYWMCIATFCPWFKMDFYYLKTRPRASCYACAYSDRLNPSSQYICAMCPLKYHFINTSWGCIPPFISWRNEINGKEYNHTYAKEIATWPWIEPKLSRE